MIIDKTNTIARGSRENGLETRSRKTIYHIVHARKAIKKWSCVSHCEPFTGWRTSVSKSYQQCRR